MKITDGSGFTREHVIFPTIPPQFGEKRIVSTDPIYSPKHLSAMPFILFLLL